MNNNSNMNTVFIVVILVLLVGFGVWYFTTGGWNPAPPEDEAEFNLNVEVPTGDDGGGDNQQ